MGMLFFFIKKILLSFLNLYILIKIILFYVFIHIQIYKTNLKFIFIKQKRRKSRKNQNTF